MPNKKERRRLRNKKEREKQERLEQKIQKDDLEVSCVLAMAAGATLVDAAFAAVPAVGAGAGQGESSMSTVLAVGALGISGSSELFHYVNGEPFIQKGIVSHAIQVLGNRLTVPVTEAKLVDPHSNPSPKKGKKAKVADAEPVVSHPHPVSPGFQQDLLRVSGAGAGANVATAVASPALKSDLSVAISELPEVGGEANAARAIPGFTAS